MTYLYTAYNVINTIFSYLRMCVLCVYIFGSLFIKININLRVAISYTSIKNGKFYFICMHIYIKYTLKNYLDMQLYFSNLANFTYNRNYEIMHRWLHSIAMHCLLLSAIIVWYVERKQQECGYSMQHSCHLELKQ